MKIQPKYDLVPVFARLRESRLSGVGGRPSLRAFESQSAMSVLESAVTFQPEIPELEKPSLIRSAVFSAARTEAFDEASILSELRRAEIEYLRQPLKTFDVLSSLGINAYGPVKGWAQRRVVKGALLSFRASVPKRIDRTDIADSVVEHISRSANALTHCVVRVESRTPVAAYQQGMDRIDLLRGIWNFFLNSGTAMRHSAGGRPVNSILPGPIHSVHNPNGSLASKNYWYEPQALLAEWLFRADEHWHDVERFARATQRRIQCARYALEIENAFVRYARALDLADMGLAFVRLWAVLELLTNAIGDYDKLIARVAFLYSGAQRLFVQSLLEHLRSVRNGWVHMDLTRSDMESHVYELKSFVEASMVFHLRNGSRFSSVATATMYLDTPKDPALLRERIGQYRRALRSDRKRL